MQTNIIYMVKQLSVVQEQKHTSRSWPSGSSTCSLPYPHFSFNMTWLVYVALNSSVPYQSILWSIKYLPTSTLNSSNDPVSTTYWGRELQIFATSCRKKFLPTFCYRLTTWNINHFFPRMLLDRLILPALCLLFQITNRCKCWRLNALVDAEVQLMELVIILTQTCPTVVPFPIHIGMFLPGHQHLQSLLPMAYGLQEGAYMGEDLHLQDMNS